MHVDDILVSLRTSGKDGLWSTYESVFVNLDMLHQLEPLLTGLNEFNNNNYAVETVDGVTVEDLLNFVNNWIIDTVITPGYNIIVDKDMVNVNFIASFLAFIADLNVANVTTTTDLQAILNDLELSNLEKLGYILAMYSDTFAMEDSYAVVDIVPSSTITDWITTVEDLLEIGTRDDTGLIEFINIAVNIDPGLIKTYTLNHIMRSGLTEFSKSDLLEHISGLYNRQLLTTSALGMELLIYALYFNVSKADITDIIDTVYANSDTSAVYMYIRLKLPEAHDEDY